MCKLLVKSVRHDRVLVSRESARLLEDAVRSQIPQGTPTDGCVIDFDGVGGIAPSFLDEVVSMVEAIFREQNGRQFELIIANPPTRLSSKFEAIARGHAMSIHLLEDGSWALRTR